MSAYAYRAKDEAGKTVGGLLEASNEGEVDSALRKQGLFIVSVREVIPRTRRARGLFIGQISRRELILFTVHLGTVLGAGIPLSGGLRDFVEESPTSRLRRVAAIVLQSVEGGALLSEAMARLPRVFPEVYVAIIRAGETSGRLDQVLQDLVKSLEWQDGIARQVRQASIYPLLLLTAFTGLMIFLVTFVFPRFGTIFARLGTPLPLPTRVVLGMGEFIKAYWLAVFLGVVCVVVAYRFLVTFSAGRLLVDRIKFRLPILGNIMRNVALARFAHHMETLHRAGVNFVLALNVLERVVGNRVIGRAVAQARERVMAGMSFTDALRSTGQFPPLVLRMVATGELSGALENSLAKVTQYYDREVPDAVRRFFTFLEPTIIAGLAVVVLGAILSVYLPIYSMLSVIRGRTR